jgi:uncharacterized membrane protein YjgN (DUF898 family)
MDSLSFSGSRVVAIGPGGRAGAYIQVRTQREYAVELSNALRAGNIEARSSVQASVETTELVALVVSIGTGLGGVAAVLSAWLRRHQDKSILVERDGSRYELRGMSVEAMEDLLSSALERAADQQRRSEHLYRGIPGADDNIDTSENEE